jgi:hypothetical protein
VHTEVSIDKVCVLSRKFTFPEAVTVIEIILEVLQRLR